MASISKVALRPREPIGFRLRVSLVPLSDRAVMLIERLVGATILAIFTSSVAASAEPPSADKMVAAFQSICAGGKTGQTAELGRADVLGWRTSGAGAPVRFDPSTQRLSPPSNGRCLVVDNAMSGSAGRRRAGKLRYISSPLTPVQGVAEGLHLPHVLMGFAMSSTRHREGSPATFSSSAAASRSRRLLEADLLPTPLSERPSRQRLCTVAEEAARTRFYNAVRSAPAMPTVDRMDPGNLCPLPCASAILVSSLGSRQ